MEPEKRKYAIYAFCLIVFFAFVIRLAYLQLFSTEELTKESNKNSVLGFSKWKRNLYAAFSGTKRLGHYDPCRFV